MLKHNRMLEVRQELLNYIILFSLLTILYCLQKQKPVEKFTNSINHKSPSHVERKKIISFSLWGNNECYNWGAVENALLAEKLYPDWVCRFYVGKDIIPEVRDILKKLDNVEVVEMKEDRASANMFWRFIPMYQEDHIAVLSRDTDSRLNEREQKSVENWLKDNTGKDLLILRNHKFHNQLVMGGMFGVKNNVFHQFKDRFQNQAQEKKKGKYMEDQIFLRDVYRKLAPNNIMVYDSHYHFPKENVLPYVETEFNGYIGQIVCNDFELTNERFNLNIQKTSIEKPYALPEDSQV